jgi:magnesium transporter
MKRDRIAPGRRKVSGPLSDTLRADTVEDILLEGEPPPERIGKVHAYARSERGVHGIPLPDAVQRIARVTRGRGAAPLDVGDPAHFVWVDVAGPGAGEVELLRDQLGFHPLAVEDCIRGRQRPKLERYPGHYFLVMYAAHINVERERVAFNELHMFIGDGFIVTVRDHRIDEVRDTVGRWRASPERFPNVGAVAHALLDAIVDDYFPMVDYFAEKAAQAESGMIEGEDQFDVQEVHELRRQLILFRRMVAPERDIVAGLLRRDLQFLNPDLVPYFQDVRDHMVRIVEEIDTLRELVATTLEGHASTSSHLLNQTMRRMAAWSIILMSMNLIASNYGMNFLRMPELAWPFGYPMAVVIMLVVGAVLGIMFHKKRWI